MNFSELMILTGNEKNIPDKNFDFTVNKLTFNSLNVEKNDIFFAVKGFNADGNKFINDALQKGAMAVITDGEPGIQITGSIKYRMYAKLWLL